MLADVEGVARLLHSFNNPLDYSNAPREMPS
jgi:hypothetical protein